MVAIPTIVEARSLTKTFSGQPAVRGIDLIIPAGGCFGLLGPNGAGKTTTLRMILGQCTITAGELRVMGMPMPASLRQVRRRIGVVPQIDNLDPDLTVEENLVVYGSFFGLRKSAIIDHIHALLRIVELEDRADRKINTLSGGMKRRLSIARALVNDPEVLVLDEPTTGLDPQVRHMIWQRLREFKRDGRTLLLTTHYMEEAERLCDDLVIMDDGRIIEQGAPRDMIKRTVEPEVFEVHGDADALQNVLAALGGIRSEQVGETLYCYSTAAALVIEQLERATGISYLHRPANLEDVFLSRTGRDLRD